MPLLRLCPCGLPGGEGEGLRRLGAAVSARPEWVCAFRKPDTAPNSVHGPSTTALSPYIKFGCVSVRTIYHELQRISKAHKGCTQPPVSLEGQLLWREYFYYYSYYTPKFDRMVGNLKCRQIPWGRDPALIEAWKLGRTGYPFIDAVMRQLRAEGWIHHLARHAVACFLTRGDLWQHWEEGVKVFDLYLLDSDWALNNANWQWLSCSNFFHQYFRVYSPVAFGKKTDKNGDYIRKWVPELSTMPAKYIYEPWLAPAAMQRSSHCVVGVDYPARIAVHEEARQANMDKMKLAFAADKNESASSSSSSSGSAGVAATVSSEGDRKRQRK
jgi:cryptochrome